MPTCQNCGGVAVPSGLYAARHGAVHAGRLITQANRSQARRRRAGASHDRFRATSERIGRARLGGWFRRVTETAVARAAAGADSGPELIRPAEFRASFDAALTPFVRHAALSGVAFERAWIEAGTGRQRLRQKGPAEVPDITIEMSVEMQRRVFAYVERRADLIFPGVEAVVRDSLTAELFKRIRAGDEVEEIATRLRKKCAQLSEASAMRIARTEANAAMNHAQQYEREDAEIEHKEWISTLDARTRTPAKKSGKGFDHLAPDGQVVTNDGLFVVSGERLAHPGDGAHGASRGNLINCRCTAAAAWPDEPLGQPVVLPPTVPQPAAVEAEPDPEPPKPPEVLPPKGITFTGQRTEFTEKVWQEIGDGITDEAHARRVGQLVADEALANVAKFEADADAAVKRAMDAHRAAVLRRNELEKNLLANVGDQAAFDAFSRASEEASAAQRAVWAAQDERGKARSRAMMEALRGVRDIGGPGHKLKGNRQLSAFVREAEGYFPSDWLKASAEYSEINVRKVARAYYHHGKRVLALSSRNRLGVAAHELFHRFEAMIPKLGQVEKAFKARRAAGETLTRIYPHLRGNKETGWKDQFAEHYMGKDYGNDRYHEILTMGIQRLLEPDGVDLWTDTDYVTFVLGVLAGV